MVVTSEATFYTLYFLDIFNFGLYPSYYLNVFISTVSLQFVNFIKQT